MSVTKRRRRVATTLVAAAGMAAAIAPASALAVAQSNACDNSATTNNNQITVDTSGTSPASVSPGDSITLSNIKQSGTIPASIFVAGYNLGVLSEGTNNIPTDFYTVLEGTNTVEGAKTTNTASSTLTTTINDPDDTPGTGDETATDASFDVSYNDLIYTAGAGGVVDFRQDTIQPVNAGTKVGSFIAVGKLFGGAIKINFACSPGAVTPGTNPQGGEGVISYIDPALTFASTLITAPPSALVTGSGTNGNASKPNTFTINAPDSSSGTITFAGSSRSYNGTISCVNVVGNSATIVSQDDVSGYLNRAFVQDNGASNDKIVNTMVRLSDASAATIAKYSECGPPNEAKLAAAPAIASGDITINSSPSARAAKKKAARKAARRAARKNV